MGGGCYWVVGGGKWGGGGIQERGGGMGVEGRTGAGERPSGPLSRGMVLRLCLSVAGVFVGGGLGRGGGRWGVWEGGSVGLGVAGGGPRWVCRGGVGAGPPGRAAGYTGSACGKGVGEAGEGCAGVGGACSGGLWGGVATPGVGASRRSGRRGGLREVVGEGWKVWAGIWGLCRVVFGLRWAVRATVERARE